MGISVEQHRSKISSHDNFLKKRRFVAFQGSFLEYNPNDVLHESRESYLPTLKQVFGQYKMWNEVVLWFTQSMYYNVYLPLLLRLANDVEENPGPAIFNEVDPTRTNIYIPKELTIHGPQ